MRKSTDIEVNWLGLGADLANCKNALANAKPEVKEVTKEVEVAGPRAIFFKIGSARLDDYGKVNIELAAKILKA